MAEKVILYDATKCTACRGCQAACKQWNENDEGTGEKTVFNGTYENPADLSVSTWIKMEFREMEKDNKLSWFFTRRSCMHCTDAGCVKVCPNGTLFHNEFGSVSYNKDICIGCGYCLEGCPFKVPRFTREGVFQTFVKVDKCSFCTTPGLNRVVEGMEPACVKTCPPKALIYGDREAMVAEGRKRVQSLKDKGYNNAYLYGDKELRGLHVLYVLEDSPQLYGLPVDPKIPGVSIAWKDVIQPLGWAVGGLTILGLALNYLVAREAKMTHELPGKKKEE